MNYENRKRCVELVYKIVNSDNGVGIVDNDSNYYLNKTDELVELCKLFDKDNKYEMNYVYGMFWLSESDLGSVEEWIKEYLQDDEESYWNKCLTEFDMEEDWLLEYNQQFIDNNYIENDVMGTDNRRF